jgi:hypothetical protein
VRPPKNTKKIKLLGNSRGGAFFSCPHCVRKEIMQVLKLCVVQGVQACNLGVPILAEELKRFSKGSAS